MKVLVTGGAGYIGSVTCRQLGDETIALDNMSSSSSQSAGLPYVKADICSSVAAEFIERFKPEVVVHLAAYAWTAGAPSPMAYWKNVEMTQRLLEAMDAAGCNKLVFASSQAVYGQQLDPVQEDWSYIRPKSIYGKSKLVCEWMIESMCTHGRMSAVIFRYPNVMGATEDIGLSGKSQLLLPRMALCALTGQGFKIDGNRWPSVDGTQVLDPVHVEDIADLNREAVEYLVRTPSGCEVFNVGGGAHVSVFQMVKRMQEVSQTLFPVDYREPRLDDAFCVPRIDSLKAVFKWSPERTLEDMMTSQLAWCKAHDLGAN